MSLVKAKLGCCDRLKSSPNTLSCQSCKLKHHLSCVKLDKPLKDLSEKFKSEWICPGCQVNIQKSDSGITQTKTGQVLVDCTQEEFFLNVSTRRGGLSGKSCQREETTEIPINSIRQIVREELEDILQTFKNNILQQFELKTKELLDSLKSVSESISVIEQNQNLIKQDVEAHKVKISRLETENTSLRTTVVDLSSRIARMEQHSRASNIEIQNIPEHKTENLITITKQVAAIANYKLNESDIHICTRVAKINRDSQRPRSVIVKLSSPRIRDEFLAATLKFNKKANSVSDKLNTSHIGIGGIKKPVFVTEHLSPTQKAIHAAARSKAKELNYKFVWIKGGKVFMRKSETSEYKLITSNHDLSELK